MPEPSKKVLCHYPVEYTLAPFAIRRRKAEKKVANRMAIWRPDGSVELTEQAVASEYEDAWLWRQNQLSAQRGYDGIDRPMQPGELRGIPFVGQDLDRMFVNKSTSGNGTWPERR